LFLYHEILKAEMKLKSMIIKPVAKAIAKKIKQWSLLPHEYQQKQFDILIKKGRNTAFGIDHNLSAVRNYEDFKKQVPIREYELLKPYIDQVLKGKENVLWPGKPLYLAKTSGTTSGTKYIPITKDSVAHHVNSARNAVFCYIAETGNASFFDGGMIFLSGSPALEKTAGILTGRLSGIVNHQVPWYVKKNQLPTYNTNCIEDWEEKVDKIVDETFYRDMRLIGGIPSWVQMYFERLLEKTNKTSIREIFPNLQLYVYGGVNYDPYRTKFKSMLGGSVDTIETYPASEGFIAFQDTQQSPGLLLQLNSGIFYEFIPAEEAHLSSPTRLQLSEVKLGVNYALVLNTNAGLWGYLIGDTIKFVSLSPSRIVVTGRTKHFISAFGEHVISEEVDTAMKIALEKEPAEVTEYHVAPQVNPLAGELPYHEWFIEFGKTPQNMDRFKQILNDIVAEKNPYYNDLMEGRILQPLKIIMVEKDGFISYMKSKGKLGGQNKVPRLADHREIADSLPVKQTH
jgi:hypothetical protein